MFQRIAIVALSCLLAFGAAAENLATNTPAQQYQQETQKPQSRTREVLTDAAVVALLIAASVAAYKAMGKPCACPSDTMRNGRRCGGNSAWARAGGYKPLCFPTDVTAGMIAAYRATKATPGLR